MDQMQEGRHLVAGIVTEVIAHRPSRPVGLDPNIDFHGQFYSCCGGQKHV